MILQEHVALAPLTTFHIGGSARVFIEAHSEEEVLEALAHARSNALPVRVLGAGSNVLVSDAGVDGVVLRIALRDISFQDQTEDCLLIAGAGTPWEEVVSAASERGIFGIENLAGIPGTLGGAAVQNIGAYGAEFSEVFEYADIIDGATGERRRVTRPEVTFAYRTSFFKEHPEAVVLRVALRLARQAELKTTYADIVRAQESGVSITTPRELASAIRVIRARKFPDITKEGTAGSFFKNPVISHELAADLTERFPGLPVFPQADGRVKVSLAWILDHVLALKGYAKGRVRLFENQPLVVVAGRGATAEEVDAFVNEVSERVFEATGIAVEREVEVFSATKKIRSEATISSEVL